MNLFLGSSDGLEVEIDGHGDLVPGVEQGDHFVPLIKSVVAQKNLQSGSNSISLHLAEQPTLLALDTIHEARDVVDVALVELDFGVLGVEEGAELGVEGAQLVVLELFRQLVQDLRRFQVLNNIVRRNGVVVQHILRDLFHGAQVDLVDEQQVLYSLRVVEHPAPILIMTDKELLRVLEPGPDLRVGGDVLVHHRDVGRNTSVEAADDFVEDGLLLAGGFGFVGLGDVEAVFLIDEFPDGFAVVVGEGLDVGVEVEVLALVVLFVLDVPDPVDGVVSGVALGFPEVFPLEAHVDLVGLDPVGGDVFFVAAADGAALGFADLVADPEFALAVQIDPDHSEVLGLDERVEQRVGFAIDLVEGRFFGGGVQIYKQGQYYQQQHVQLKHFGGYDIVGRGHGGND